MVTIGHHGPEGDLGPVPSHCLWFDIRRPRDRQEHNSLPNQHVPPATAALTLVVCNWLGVAVSWRSLSVPRQLSLLYLFEDYRALACL